MSQNNTIRKSDKKFIRTEKARIRAMVLDLKKQQEMIDKLYEKFLTKPAIKEAAPEKKAEVKKEEKPKAKKEIKKAKAK